MAQKFLVILKLSNRGKNWWKNENFCTKLDFKYVFVQKWISEDLDFSPYLLPVFSIGSKFKNILDFSVLYILLHI